MKNYMRYIALALIVCLLQAVPGISAGAAGTLTIEGASSITANGGAAQLRAYYNGEDVTTNVTWSLSQGAQYAAIGTDGVLYAYQNGTVTVTAVYAAENVRATKTVSISNQTNPQLRLSCQGVGNIVREKGMDSEESWGYLRWEHFPAGTEFFLTAEETDTEFLFWRDDLAGRIITYDPEYRFTLGADRVLTAIYRGGTNKYIIFRDDDGTIFHFGYLIGTNTHKVPNNPVKPGYQFDGWYLDGVRQSLQPGQTLDSSDADEDKIYIARFIRRSDRYTVTVTGGSGSGSYLYNEEVSVTLDPDSVPEGKRFDHWEKDGVPVSKDDVYVFRAGSDTQVTAVYADAVSSLKTPYLQIGEPVVSASDRSFTYLSEWSLPLDYTLVETGILVSTSRNFSLKSSSAQKAASLSQENGGQFTVRKTDVSAGTTWYAKAYMIYKYNGTLYTMYSDTVSASL